MATRRVIVLACDECGAEPHRRFRTFADLDAWIRQNGWQEIYYRDWCPRCLAASQRRVATPTTETNGE